MSTANTRGYHPSDIVFDEAHRLRNTREGNARWLIQSEDGRAWETKGNAHCNLLVSAYRRGDRLRLWLTSKGIIALIDNFTAMEREAEQEQRHDRARGQLAGLRDAAIEAGMEVEPK